ALERGRARRPGAGLRPRARRRGRRPASATMAGRAPPRAPEPHRRLVIGVAGSELTAQERDGRRHDAAAGVILAERTVAPRAQAAARSAAIREAAARASPARAARAGGRGQRFRGGSSESPRLKRTGELYARDPPSALPLAAEPAWLTASEIRASGV